MTNVMLNGMATEIQNLLDQYRELAVVYVTGNYEDPEKVRGEEAKSQTLMRKGSRELVYEEVQELKGLMMQVQDMHYKLIGLHLIYRRTLP